MTKPLIALALRRELVGKIFSKEDFEHLKSFAEVTEAPEESDEESIRQIIKGADGCITCWGSPQFSKKILDEAPNLKIIAHSAGSVKRLVSEEVWQRGIAVTSAAAAIAIGVAEFTLGMMLMVQKRAFWMNELTHAGHWRVEEESDKFREAYGCTVGVIGASHCGRHFMRLLRNLDVEMLLYDPLCPPFLAHEMGAEKVELDDLMARSDVVSIHAPNIPSTFHMVNRENLKLMKEGAILINTSRGALIDEEALIEVLEAGKITACLDVTEPEPPARDSPLRRLPNVILTPHIAGAVGNNILRQGRYTVRELEKFFAGKKLIYQVTRDMLDYSA